jgi:hypothetical protein
MPGPNVYFTQGTINEQRLMEDMIIESLHIYGQNLFYIPRTLVSKDNILGEDRLSQFKASFPIEMYFENVDSFDGQGAFMQKFGLMMEQSATLVVARRRWEQLVGRYGQTTIPTRPNEGDLLYFPLTGGLFEIKFVKHQDPFYQLGKLYVYKLQVELFQYSSERIDTGIPEIDVFETLKTFSTNTTRSGVGEVKRINVTNPGSGYTTATVEIVTSQSFVLSRGLGATAEAVITDGSITAINVTNPGNEYTEPPLVNITGDGTGATAVAVVGINIDKVESYGDNNSFKEEAKESSFNEFNPFGDIDP